VAIKEELRGKDLIITAPYKHTNIQINIEKMRLLLEELKNVKMTKTV